MQSKKLAAFLKNIPGRQYFGHYRFLPIFFLLGGVLELSMIKWDVNGVNFCKLVASIDVTMPAGVTWGVYGRFLVAALLSMFAGSQTVHYIYKPLEDFNSLVEEEKQRILHEQDSGQKQ